MPPECVIVPTYRREPHLFCCLKRLRDQDASVPIFVFSDRGEKSDDLVATCERFEAALIVQPKHDYQGNSYNAAEALRFAYNADYKLTSYVEDDFFAKPDLLSWTREMHEELDGTFNLFASCGWIFNHYMPYTNENYLAPWIYIPQFSITRKKMELVLPHLNPFYYRDMVKYVTETFPENAINKLYPAVVHYEIDGLLQRVLMEDKSQSVWCATTKGSHAGWGGYNRGWDNYEDAFIGCNTFEERVGRVEELMADVYWRAETFGRSHVEHEVGHAIPKRTYKYRITLPGGWSCEAESELGTLRPTMKVKSVRLPHDAIVEKILCPEIAE